MDNLLLIAAQMRALEAAAIESGTVTGLELMERAGVGAVDAILSEWPDLATSPGRAVVLCGPGNNGGDGFVVARVLAGKGWDVEVFLHGDPAKLPPEARVNYERWLELRQVEPIPDICVRQVATETVDVLVDAVFGTGLSRQVDRNVVAQINAHLLDDHDEPIRPRVVALDICSGIDADSGRCIGSAAGADLTVAFHERKLGHVLGDGPNIAGRVVKIGIGLGRETSTVAGVVRAQRRPTLGKGWIGYKYHHGHALILTGGMGRTGAARLSARAALRVGAGLVTCAASGAAMMECAMQLTAVMLRRCDDAEALTALLDDERINALCLGPGMGVSERESALLDVALATNRKMVLDADALTILAARDDPFALLHDRCVLTPHGGEFGRLFPDFALRLTEPVNKGPCYSKVDATRDAAKRAGCTVLFKGPDTVIADERGHARINAAVYDRAVPWLATAGAGDVLAGIITGLMARGWRPLDAASSGAWLHVEAARAFGPGLIAEDLPEMLPGVLSALEG